MLQKDGIRSSSQQYVYGKLKEEQTWEEYKSMVRDKVEEEEWKHLDVNEHWHKVKKEQHSTYGMWNVKRSLQGNMMVE